MEVDGIECRAHCHDAIAGQNFGEGAGDECFTSFRLLYLQARYMDNLNLATWKITWFFRSQLVEHPKGLRTATSRSYIFCSAMAEVIKVDDMDPKNHYSGIDWTPEGVKEEYLGTKHGTSVAGAQTSFTLQETAIGVYGMITNTR